MQPRIRQFEVGSDPFGRRWEVHFRWLQTAIAIRHADTVDVKFVLSCDGAEEEEKVIALPHAALLAVAREHGRTVTDPWCLRIAGLHLRRMIETGDAMEQTLVTLTGAEVAALDQELFGGAPTN